jgi:sulfite reductase (NADPH) flavoprotein alpha-component
MKSDARLCQILNRYPLTLPEAGKHVFHVELSWDANHPYRPGDCLAIEPCNHPDLIEKVLGRIKKNDSLDELKDHLKATYSVTKASGKLFRVLAEHAHIGQDLHTFNRCLEDSNFAKEFLKEHEVWDILERFEIVIGAKELIEGLQPLHPRFYSIASSFLQQPDRLSLIIAHVHYHNRYERKGVCSDFLQRSGFDVPEELLAWVHPTRDFLLPDDAQDILMIGPGTGVAPFCAFMQHRLKKQAIGKSWLFFGERSHQNLYYESFWNECTQKLPFELTCAFSRDQPQKIYVQHRLLEHGERIWDWLQQATVYICGDAAHMAKDVENTLLEIIMHYGKQDQEQARAFLKTMRQEKRFLKDVY